MKNLFNEATISNTESVKGGILGIGVGAAVTVSASVSVHVPSIHLPKVVLPNLYGHKC